MHGRSELPTLPGPAPGPAGTFHAGRPHPSAAYLWLTKNAYFHSAEAIIVMAKLCLGGLCPPLPDRS